MTPRSFLSMLVFVPEWHVFQNVSNISPWLFYTAVFTRHGQTLTLTPMSSGSMNGFFWTTASPGLPWNLSRWIFLQHSIAICLLILFSLNVSSLATNIFLKPCHTSRGCAFVTVLPSVWNLAVLIHGNPTRPQTSDNREAIDKSGSYLIVLCIY